MPVEMDHVVGEAMSWLVVSLAGCLLAVPTVALVGFGLLAVVG